MKNPKEHNSQGVSLTHDEAADGPIVVYNPVFVGFLATVLQTICIHCHRTRYSPWYMYTQYPFSMWGSSISGSRFSHRNRIFVLFFSEHSESIPGFPAARILRRLKAIAASCVRQIRCTHCNRCNPVIKQQGLCIVARHQSTAAVIPPLAAFIALIQVPDGDMEALGFHVRDNPSAHPASAVMSVLPVLPPVSRPSMHSVNVKTGRPVVTQNRKTPVPV